MNSKSLALDFDNKMNVSPLNHSSKASSVRKLLSSLVFEEVSRTAPFKVTYVSNKRATIVRCRTESSISTNSK